MSAGFREFAESDDAVPSELNPRRLWRRLFALAGGAIAVAIVVAVPSLAKLRKDLVHASAAWLVIAIASEALSALSYVLLFRSVFCPRMPWALTYQIGMSEQGANSILSVSGAGGIALGVWALRRAGMQTERIARRSVAFFLLTSLANVAVLAVVALLYLVDLLHRNPAPGLTYAFGGAAVVVSIAVTCALPRLKPTDGSTPADARRRTRAKFFVRNSVSQGVRDALVLLRRTPAAILAGSLGTMGFDLAVLGLAYKAFGHSPAIGVLALGYLIGQLGGNLPIPGGIGGVDAGLIGTFVLYHQPLAATTAAVLAYHAISLWVPGVLGTFAFAQLRRTLSRETEPASVCMPLIDPIDTVALAAGAGTV
jgi:uncharacterized membrane protein YbhN (UPF0104 family)